MIGGYDESRPVVCALHGKEAEKLSAMDVLARASMKDAAKCDTHCELQISVNHQISERIWRCRDFPAARLFQCLLTTPKYTIACKQCGKGIDV